MLFMAKHVLWGGGMHPEDGNHAIYHHEVRTTLEKLGLNLELANTYKVLFEKPDVDFVFPLLNRGGFLNAEMLAPLMLTLYSALTGERISRGQWTSLTFSLLGVLVIVRPGSELFTPAILLPVAAAASYAAYQLITRKLSNTDHPVTSNFLSSLVGTLLLSLLVPFFWETPTPGMALKMFGLGALGMVAHLLLTQALRIASAASLAPFTYLNIVFAGLVGWVLFDQVPDLPAMLGMGIIIASGVGFALASRRAQP